MCTVFYFSLFFVITRILYFTCVHYIEVIFAEGTKKWCSFSEWGGVHYVEVYLQQKSIGGTEICVQTGGVHYAEVFINRDFTVYIFSFFFCYMCYMCFLSLFLYVWYMCFLSFLLNMYCSLIVTRTECPCSYCAILFFLYYVFWFFCLTFIFLFFSRWNIYMSHCT
jgi:hypothetical protein